MVFNHLKYNYHSKLIIILVYSVKMFDAFGFYGDNQNYYYLFVFML